MIRNDNEYARALERIAQEKELFAAEEQRLLKQYTVDEVQALMDPLLTFHAQLLDDVRLYERLKKGDLGELTNLRGAGRMLVHLRIARGLSQRDLATRMGVNESQVSRDERNEYHGVTLDRASKILDAIGATVKTTAAVVPERVRRNAGWQPPAKKAKEIPLSENSVDNICLLNPTENADNADLPHAA